MGITIRNADLKNDREILIEFLFQNLTNHSNDSRFEWLYLKNPWGTAKVLIALEETRNMVVGVAAAFPRLVRVKGHDVTCWTLGDFAIKSEFRSLGPALQLQRACLAPITDGEIAFCYDYPARAMIPIYNRMNISSIAKIIRFAKPIAVDRKVNELTRIDLLAKGMISAGNKYLVLKDRLTQQKCTYSIDIHKQRPGIEFTELNHRVIDRYGICIQRKAEYLNWRYLDNSYQPHEIITLRDGSMLLAYAVLAQTGRDAVLADIFGDNDPKIIHALIQSIIPMLRRKGIYTFSCPVLETSPLIPILKKIGFIPRESSSVVFYTRPKGPFESIVLDSNNWFLTHGDRDS